MRKILLLLFAALAVAITVGRETSAVSKSSDKPRTLNALAFGGPIRPSNGIVFGGQIRQGTSVIGKLSYRLAMLPLGAETGRHIPSDIPQAGEISVKDSEQSKSID
ncbi:MAG TPA: hypothetical protein VKC60_11830, partial [Opitutaceae bacterium]|nr:hypothetical protein [Opitutaceae bacterium]